MPSIIAIPHSTADAPRSPVDADRLASGQPSQTVVNAYSDPGEASAPGTSDSRARTPVHLP